MPIKIEIWKKKIFRKPEYVFTYKYCDDGDSYSILCAIVQFEMFNFNSNRWFSHGWFVKTIYVDSV